jgi:hypothetical protein
MSACEVDDVAATAAGVTGLRAGVGAVTRRRTGGTGPARGGCGGAAAVVAVGGTSFAAAVAAGACGAGGLDFGTTLRATGRGFGSGIFDFAGAVAAHADTPNASVRLAAITVDKAVDRNRGARVTGGTGSFAVESFRALED